MASARLINSATGSSGGSGHIWMQRLWNAKNILGVRLQ